MSETLEHIADPLDQATEAAMGIRDMATRQAVAGIIEAIRALVGGPLNEEPPKEPELRIVVMPGRVGGQPTIGDSRLEAAYVAQGVWEGSCPVEEWAYGWNRHPDEIRLACWWWVTHGHGPGSIHRHWQEWAQQWNAWASDPAHYPNPGDPPPKPA